MDSLIKFNDINTFIFDVDGVLTNSQLLVLESGRLLRQMNVKDGYAINTAIKKGYKIAIITGGKSEGVVKRLQGLGVIDIYSGIQDKKEAFDEFTYTYNIDRSRILYMGDDVPDYEVMRLVGLPTCPLDAVPEIKSLSQYVSPLKGGMGCVRDVIERVLRLQNNW